MSPDESTPLGAVWGWLSTTVSLGAVWEGRAHPQSLLFPCLTSGRQITTGTRTQLPWQHSSHLYPCCRSAHDGASVHVHSTLSTVSLRTTPNRRAAAAMSAPKALSHRTSHRRSTSRDCRVGSDASAARRDVPRSSHAVASWEVTRSLFKCGKPGSRSREPQLMKRRPPAASTGAAAPPSVPVDAPFVGGGRVQTHRRRGELSQHHAHSYVRVRCDTERRNSSLRESTSPIMAAADLREHHRLGRRSDRQAHMRSRYAGWRKGACPQWQSTGGTRNARRSIR